MSDNCGKGRAQSGMIRREEPGNGGRRGSADGAMTYLTPEEHEEMLRRNEANGTAHLLHNIQPPRVPVKRPATWSAAMREAHKRKRAA